MPQKADKITQYILGYCLIIAIFNIYGHYGSNDSISNEEIII